LKIDRTQISGKPKGGGERKERGEGLTVERQKGGVKRGNCFDHQPSPFTETRGRGVFQKKKNLEKKSDDS